MKNLFLIIAIHLFIFSFGQDSKYDSQVGEPRSETYTDSLDGTFRTKNRWDSDGNQTIKDGFGFWEYKMWEK